MGRDQAPRGSGRGGRGNNRPHQNKSRSNQSSSSKQGAASPKKDVILKFGVNTSTTNYAPFATVQEKIATHIQKSYDSGHDLAKSIRTGTLFDLSSEKPIRQLANPNEKKADRELIQSGFDIEFSNRMAAHIKRENFLKSNLPKAFAYIMNDYCTDGLKNRLVALSDFETSIQDDPLALLQAIKTCVHENAVTQYPPVTILQHWSRLLNLKQTFEEDPPTYAKRFQQQLDTVQGYVGNTFTDGFAEQMPKHKANAYRHNAGTITALLATHVTDDAARQALAADLHDLFSHYKPKETQAQLDIKAQAQSQFDAYLFLRSASKAKYGSLLKTLQQQYSLGQAHYPESIYKVVDILSQHPWDQTPSQQNKSNNNNRTSHSTNRSQVSDTGNNRSRDNNHTRSNDNSRDQSRHDSSQSSAPSFAQQPARQNSDGQQPRSNAICHACGAQGHIHPECTKNIPKERWWIQDAFQAVQDLTSDAPPSEITTRSDDQSTGSQRSQRSSNSRLNRRSDAPSSNGWQVLQFFNVVDDSPKPEPFFGFSQAAPPTKLSDVFFWTLALALTAQSATRT